MVKVWKDANEVIKATVEIPKELWEYEKEMKKKPKRWDENEYNPRKIQNK